MGIQINGQTDTITAIDGGLNVSGADLGSASAGSLNVTGIVTASGGFSGNVTGNINSIGVSTFSNGVVVASGSTLAPSISPTGDSNTGIFFPSADTIAFAEGGVEALRVDSSGNLGIGTATVSGKIQVSSAGSRVALFGPVNSFTNLYSSYLDGQSNVGLEITSNAASGQGGAGLVLSNSQTASGCSIGGISFATSGTSGSEKRGALITSQLESSSATSVTSNLIFYTTNAGTIAERARIDSSGRLTLPYQPFAFVARNGNVSMTIGAKIPYNIVLDSRNLTWDTTNNNFVVPVTGVYTFSIYIRLEITNAAYIHAQIRSNGSLLYNPSVLYLQKPNTLSAFQTVGVTISVKLTQNDTVDVIGSWDGSSPATLFAMQSSMSIVFNG